MRVCHGHMCQCACCVAKCVRVRGKSGAGKVKKLEMANHNVNCDVTDVIHLSNDIRELNPTNIRLPEMA